MNRNLHKAFGAVIASVAFAHIAHAQTPVLGGPYDPNCWPPNSTTGPSTDFNAYFLENTLWGCEVGIAGTDTYGKQCIGPNGGSLTMAGRFGFTVGTTGSVQSSADDNLTLTFGMPFAVGDSLGFAMLTSLTTTGTFTQKCFGSGGIGTAYYGSSDRYLYAEDSKSLGNVDAQLRMDVLGDASRFQWTLYNTGTAAMGIGLEAGSWVVGAVTDPEDSPIGYCYSPGYKPFLTEQIFTPATGIPTSVTFGLSQASAYGLQVINSPLAVGSAEGINAPDQTQVSYLELGRADDILNGIAVSPFTNPPNPPAWPYPTGFVAQSDVDFMTDKSGNLIDDAAFLQVWAPTTVAPGEGTTGGRQIIAYYRSTWGVSDYARPFAAVVDAPLSINTATGNPSNYAQQTFDLRVYLDNVRGYATTNQSLTLTNTRCQVSLPQGMVDANNTSSRSIVGYFPAIPPQTVGFIDFQVNVLSTIAPGPQQYTVQINTTTGASKTLVGTINVAATPRLNIVQGANLVSVPWIFQSPDWPTILGMTPNTQFQAFNWDAPNQQYVVSTNAAQAVGTFIVSSNNAGLISLGGTPTQDPNTFSSNIKVSSSQISANLSPGWNLIGNPFNYSFPLGQLVGVDEANQSSGAQTWSTLVAEGLVSGSLAYYDPSSQGYLYIQNNSDLVLPNQGYWIYVSDPEGIVLNYPVILAPFTSRAQTPTWTQSGSQWRLNLSAHNSTMLDAQNYVGVASAAVAKVQNQVKPPVPPVNAAISLSIEDTQKGKLVKMARSMRTTGAAQTWTVDVYSKSAGPVTVTWPNMTTVPSGVQFKMVDTATGVSRDLRMTSGYTFNATAGGTRSFTITSVPGSASRAIIGNVSVSTPSRSVGGPLTVTYSLATNATTSIRVLQYGRGIAQLIQARADNAGQSTASWNLRDSANRTVAPGLYQLEITVTGSDGQIVRRLVPATVTR
jgi:hypothetical protein